MSLKITDPKEIERLINRGMLNKKHVGVALESMQVQKTQSTAQSSEELLYRLLLPVYGSHAEGGELVMELQPLTKPRYRIDVALPNYRLAIEVDGLKGHSLLADGSPNIAGFKRDRTKDLTLALHGWQVIRCMRSHIQKEQALVLSAIASIVRERTKIPVEIRKSATSNIFHLVR